MKADGLVEKMVVLMVGASVERKVGEMVDL